jgi:hypothetical protein
MQQRFEVIFHVAYETTADACRISRKFSGFDVISLSQWFSKCKRQH